jgi:hypothetical protein
MTQAFNLSQFANTLNTSGQASNSGLQNTSVTVTAGTGMSGGGAVALGSSVTLNNAGVTSVTAGTGISVSASTGGVTISNSATSYSGIGSKIFTTSGTFTIPSNITQLLVTVVGGGGAGYNGSYGQDAGGGGGGGTIQGYISGLTAGSNVYVTVGGSGGSSSFGSYLTATAGATGNYIYGGAGGSSSASGATIVYQATGKTGSNNTYFYCCGSAYTVGGGGGNSGVYLDMPSFSFYPRGSGGQGSGFNSGNTINYNGASGGNAGLIIINW